MVHTPTKMQNQLVENRHSGQAPAFLSLFFLRISFPSVLISVCLFLSSYTAEVDSEAPCLETVFFLLIQPSLLFIIIAVHCHLHTQAGC